MSSSFENQLKNRLILVFTTIITLCILLLLFASCGEVVSIELDKTTATMYVGENLMLVATADRENAQIVWYSDATHIATVDQQGVVTAISAGEVTIKAKSGNIKATCDITVIKKQEEDIVVEKTVHHEGKEEACMQDGNIEYWTKGDRYYKDANCKQEITLNETVIKKLGHDFENGKYEIAENTHQKVCARSNCGKLSQSTAHVYTSGICVCGKKQPESAVKHAAKDATCTQEGNIEYWTKGGKYYKDATCMHEITINATITTKLEHKFEGDYIVGESIHQRTCVRLGCNELSQGTVHTYTSGVCVCGKKQPESAVKHVAKDATCTQDGNIEYWAKGGKYYKDANCIQEITLNATITTKLGHNFIGGEYIAEITTHKQKCVRCNEYSTAETHVYNFGLCKCGKIQPKDTSTIAGKYSDYFLIGAAVQANKLSSGYGNLMKNFNSITAENNMKWKNLQPTEGSYKFNSSSDNADALISWAKANNVVVRGHCLLWYKSLPTWLHDKFDAKSYSESLKASALGYIDTHIETVMKHFGNNVYVWDVVNEALYNSVDATKLNNKSKGVYGDIWRTNDNMTASTSDWVDWYKVCGGYEYIAYAFKKADQVRKANNLAVDLYYNDYGLNDPYKRQACLNLVKMLKDSNAPIDGIGMQAHYKLSAYTVDKITWLKNFEDSIKAFIDAGLDVQITELDIRFDGELTSAVEAEQAEMYGKIFEICRKYAKISTKAHGITSVTTWGVQDGCNGAWGNNQYPLLFNEALEPKKAYTAIMNF